MIVRDLIGPLLEDDFHSRNRELDEAIVHVDSAFIKHNAFQGSAHVLKQQGVYEQDISARKNSFLAIARRCIPQLRDQPAHELLVAIKDLAHETVGAHIADVQRRLLKFAESIKFGDANRLDLGKARVLRALDRELEILIQQPPSLDSGGSGDRAEAKWEVFISHASEDKEEF